MTNDYRPNYRNDIQGIRALSVLIVLLYHSGIWVFPGGYVGVDVFFVISGFLISSNLLEELTKTGKVVFAQFYAKRVRRIFPAALTTVALTVVASWLFVPPIMMKGVLEEGSATVAFVPNFLFASQETNYLREPTPSLFQHFWSLGIEEQFYALWPLAMLATFVLLKNSLHRLATATVLFAVASFVLCLVLMLVAPTWSFFMFPTRAWEFAAGATLAIVLQRWRAKFLKPVSTLLFWAGIFLLAIAVFGFDDMTLFPGPFAVVPVASTVLLILSGAGHATPTGRGWMTTVPMLWTGKISYSLYLVHWPLLLLPQVSTGIQEELSLEFRLFLGAVSFPVAWTMWKFVEAPALKMRYSKIKPSRIAIAAILSTGTLLIVFVSWQTTYRNLDAGRPAPMNVISVSPLGTDYVPSNLVPTLYDAEKDNPEIYASGCHRDTISTDASGCQFGTLDAPIRVAILGDSHAASWYPALRSVADHGLIYVDMNSKSSCPTPNILTVIEGTPYRECAKWRRSVIERLVREKPDVVLLANSNHYSNSDLHEHSSFEDSWTNGLYETVERLRKTSKVAIIADVPYMGSSPSYCLSDNLADASACDRPRDEVFNEVVLSIERKVSAKSQSDLIDLTQFICNVDTCPTIIGNELVYRDSNHLTATFSRSLGRVLYDQIKSL